MINYMLKGQFTQKQIEKTIMIYSPSSYSKLCSSIETKIYFKECWQPNSWR